MEGGLDDNEIRHLLLTNARELQIIERPKTLMSTTILKMVYMIRALTVPQYLSIVSSISGLFASELRRNRFYRRFMGGVINVAARRF